MENIGASGNADKGGVEFSLANLCRCMCFTHEDTNATDTKVGSQRKLNTYLQNHFIYEFQP